MGSLSRSLSTRLIRLRGKRSFDSRPYGDGVWSVDDAENDGQGICYRAGDWAREDRYGNSIARARERDLYQDWLSRSLSTHLITRYSLV